jgi:hypothetical protein
MVLTPKQQQSHKYYLEHRDQYLENAKRYRESHREEMREYQAQYFQQYKNSPKYKEQQEKRVLWRQQRALERHRQKIEEHQRQEQERLNYPLIIERPPEKPTVEPFVQSTFVVKFL